MRTFVIQPRSGSRLLFAITHPRRMASTLVVCASLFGVAHAETIVVEGNKRVDPEIIRQHFKGSSEAELNQGYKDLLATGLFAEVKVRHETGSLVVAVRETPRVNRVAFEGNSKVKTEQLAAEVGSKSGGPYQAQTVEADLQRIRDVYRRAGRVDASVGSRLVDLADGRRDIVFTIDEGSKTGVKSIRFVGNRAVSSYRLHNLMQTTEMNFLSFFKTSDVYDPDRIAADEELIRKYYQRHGYADFRITGSDAHYDETQKGYVVTITLDEGAPYRVSVVDVDSNLPNLSADALKKTLLVSVGQSYDGDLVDKSVEALTRELGKRGYPFAIVTPRLARDAAGRKIALGFVVQEGTRAYIERIEIHGNTRTREPVIRREFEIGEGDAYNKVMIDRAEHHLEALGFFKSVKITSRPGSSSDRIILDVAVEDQSTGNFGISGGYSTTDGLISELSVTESNFLGRGQYVRASVSLGQYGKGVGLSFTEPYFLGYHLAAGFDLYAKQQENNQYTTYSTWTTGGTVRLGIPMTDELTFSPRYSLYNTNLSIPNTTSTPYNDCTNPIAGVTPLTAAQKQALAGNPAYANNPTATTSANCMTNGEASLAVKQAQGSTLTSMAGYSIAYNTLDNRKNPTNGVYAEFRQDVAGLGGDSHFVRTSGDLRYYHPLTDDITGSVRVQSGDEFAYGGSAMRLVDNFNLGPALVRGFAPGGIGPRDISDPNNTSALGGTHYIGTSAEMAFPLGLPQEIGLHGAVFADAGTLWGYQGATDFRSLLGLSGSACNTYIAGVSTTQGSCIAVQDAKTLRSSVGASLVWDSPVGPLRLDYAYALTKDKYDVLQRLRFTGGGF